MSFNMLYNDVIHDENHGSTVLVPTMPGCAPSLPEWQMPINPPTRLPVGGLPGIEKHYRELSERSDFSPCLEKAIHQFGYGLLARFEGLRNTVHLTRN